MNLSDLKINPLFENLLPPLSDEEFLGLEADIVKRQRILSPILVWSKTNEIIDGHNRRKILIAHKMDTDNITTMDFETESEVMRWIVDSQFAKRNLKKSEKVMLLAKVEEQIAKEAEAKVAESGKLYGKGHPKVTANLPQPNEEKKRNDTTAGQMAKKIGVSEKTYRAMRTVVQKGTPDQIARMDRGGRGNSPSAIAKEIKEGIPDGHRKCIHCGAIKKEAEFKPHENTCKECRNKMDRERKAKKDHAEAVNEEEKELPGHIEKEKTLKKPFANSYAPRSDYYSANAVVEWTFKDIEAEISGKFEEAFSATQTVLKEHAHDIFSERENVLKLADLIHKLGSHVFFLEREIRNESDSQGEETDATE